jgi:hypothetical protein
MDPNRPESYLSMAIIKFFQNWIFPGAEVSIQKAIDLGLKSALLHQTHGMLLIALGRFDEGYRKNEPGSSTRSLVTSIDEPIG